MRRALLAALLAACNASPPEPVVSTPAVAVVQPLVEVRACMGTRCEVQVVHADGARARRAIDRGFAEIDRVAALLTSWTETSDISRINAAAGRAPVKVARETIEVVQRGLWIAGETDGAFDITVGVFRGLWKFDEDRDGTLPDPAEVKRRVALVGWRDVVVDEAASTVMLRREGMRLNVEGIAKGYCVDAAVRAMRAEGVRDFLVQAGGDLFASGRRGDRDWRVGVQDPRGPRGQTIFELSLSDRAFNTSGDYERFVIRDGTRFHHILDARTGFPSHASRAVTVLAPDAFTADVLDTALFVLGPERALALVARHPGVEAVIVDPDNAVHVSPGLAGRLTKVRDPSPGL